MTTGTQRGTLTIAGSGIACVAHITLQMLSYIKESDKLFYLVCDPVTEAFIQDNATGDCFDLSVFYDKNKSRYDSYIQMCEVMLRAVRAGHHVLGVFYGHPGVSVSPSYRAIAVAREEGYKARMLPGISTEDYLFADLEFDPCSPGCNTYEATELLLRDRSLDPSIHNIIWQVGSDGVIDMQFEKSKFHLLVDRLEKDFGPDHKVVHYIGAVLPQSTTTMDTFTVLDLRKEDVAKQFGTISTLYIPSRDNP
ncbi:tetrapyrrole methylase, partial [Rhizopogon vinicolor AM-OR11-026]